MADPQHVPELDGFDRLTVRLYRAGLTAAGLGLLALAAAWAFASEWRAGGELLVVAGAACAIANMHLYDKRIRWVIGAAGWTGAALLFAARALPDLPAHWVHHAGLGFVFVSLSAFALKEQFCFKIPLLRAVPAFLALSLVPMLAGSGLAVAALLVPAGGVYLALAAAKHRMPLHFDVGNKAAYQI